MSLIMGFTALPAEVWVRDAAVGLESSGSVEIHIPNNDSTYRAFETPQYFPGIFSCEVQAAGSVLIELSNQARLSFRGEGFFSVERAESLFSNVQAVESGLESERSHLILNLRRGELLIDSRRLKEDSKLILEAPFGRISVENSVLLVQIEFDHRSGIYDFTISSAEGAARLNDHRRQSYMIYPGQRLSGAGSYSAPAIEVGEQMGSIREKFQAYFNRLDKVESLQIDTAKFQAQLKVLTALGLSGPASRISTERSIQNKKRPRIIEYAPRTTPVTPFRAEIKAPSDSQADLF